MWRIAVLHHGSPSSPALAGLRERLHGLGLIDGDDCIIEAAGAEGRWAQLPVLVDQLLRRGPDVIVAIGALAALAAQRATTRLPLLHAIVLDPADVGLTASNVSGITTFDPAQATRHLRLLQELVPGLRNVICLTDVDAPKGPDGRNPLVSQLLRAGATQGLAIKCVAVSEIDADLERSIDAVPGPQGRALVALEVPAVVAQLRGIGRLAERKRLPMLCPHDASNSGVVMQGAALQDAIAFLAAYVAALMRGATVAELPVRFVRHERLVVHRGRAERIGVSVPLSMLKRATQCLDDRQSDAATAGC